MGFTYHLYPPSIHITSIYHKYNLPIRIGLSCCFEVSNSDDDNKILLAVFISILSWPWTKVEVNRITKVIQRRNDIDLACDIKLRAYVI